MQKHFRKFVLSVKPMSSCCFCGCHFFWTADRVLITPLVMLLSAAVDFWGRCRKYQSAISIFHKTHIINKKEFIMWILSAIIIVINCIIIPILNRHCATVKNKLKGLYRYSFTKAVCKQIYSGDYLIRNILINGGVCFLILFIFEYLSINIAVKIYLLYIMVLFSSLSIFGIIDDLNS